MSLWWVMLGLMLTVVEARPSESSERVTIDLSALRPSLPGLVLYKYGDLAPKLVQVDLSALNPRLQPHVIWPQFNEMDLGERGFDMDNTEAIPYLTEEESLIYNSYPKQQSQRMMSRMSGHWLDSGSRNDLYDFVPESQDKLLSLSGSLPVADEVIVPLDWEEKDSKKKGKRNIFSSRGWGGASYSKVPPNIRKVNILPNTNSYFTANPVQEPSALRRRERESEDSRSLQGGEESQNSAADPRVPSQESWAIPRQYWSIPHLI